MIEACPMVPQCSDPGRTQGQDACLQPDSPESAHAQQEVTRSLEDLPGAWLLQLLDQLDQGDRLPAFKTCAVMRDLMLACNCKLCFTWPISPEQAAPAQAALVRACRSSPDVILYIKLPTDYIDDPGITVDINAGLGALLSGAMATLNGTLQAIKTVNMEGLLLDSLVPLWLHFSCPHMTAMHVNNCQFTTLPAPPGSIPTHKQLRQLHLAKLEYDITKQHNFARWQHQLRALPSLQHLSLHVGGTEQPDQPERWLESCSVVGAQLTFLECIWPYIGPRFISIVLPTQFAAWFPNLCTLHLPILSVRDSTMEALLSLHSLKSLECWEFELDSSFTHRPCAWTHVHIGVLAIDQIPLLPLDNVTWLGPSERDGTPGAFTIYPDGVSPEAMESAAIAIARCGGIRWGDPDRLCICMARLMGMDTLAAMLPLLAGCKVTSVIVYEAKPVTPELLITLQPALAHSFNSHLSSVEFFKCTWAHPDVCRLVVASLPEHVSDLMLHAKGGLLTEEQFIAMCVAACRPIKVTVADGSDEWAVGWEQRVRQAVDAMDATLEVGAAGKCVLTIKKG